MATFNGSIQASDDDGIWIPTATTFNNDFTELIVGKPSGIGGQTCNLYLWVDNVTIPPGSTITSAIWTLVAVATLSATTVSATIRLVDADDAAHPTSLAEATGLTLTTASTAWTNIPTQTAGVSQQTPNWSSPLQEVIDRPGWASGNAICFVMHDNGSTTNAARSWASFDHTTLAVPALAIDYTEPETGEEITLNLLALGPTLFSPGLEAERELSLDQLALAPELFEPMVEASSVALSSGPNLVASGSESGSAWSNEGNVTASDNAYATWTTATDTTSPYLLGLNPGFSVPSTATILGVEAHIEGKVSDSGRLKVGDVTLWHAGAAIGTPRAVGDSWTTGDVVNDYGGPSILWEATLTPEIVNASSFGVGIRFDPQTATSLTASVDAISLTVYYSVPVLSINAAVADIAPTLETPDLVLAQFIDSSLVNLEPSVLAAELAAEVELAAVPAELAPEILQVGIEQDSVVAAARLEAGPELLLLTLIFEQLLEPALLELSPNLEPPLIASGESTLLANLVNGAPTLYAPDFELSVELLAGLVELGQSFYAPDFEPSVHLAAALLAASPTLQAATLELSQAIQVLVVELGPSLEEVSFSFDQLVQAEAIALEPTLFLAAIITRLGVVGYVRLVEDGYRVGLDGRSYRITMMSDGLRVRME